MAAPNASLIHASKHFLSAVNPSLVKIQTLFGNHYWQDHAVPALPCSWWCVCHFPFHYSVNSVTFFFNSLDDVFLSDISLVCTSLASDSLLPHRKLLTWGKGKVKSCTIFYYYKATDKYINVLKKIRTLLLLKKSFKFIQKFLSVPKYSSKTILDMGLA